MNASDLIRDPGTGMVSHTKLWANIAYATATTVVIRMAYADTLTSDILLIYLGIVGASTAASKFLSMRFAK